MNLIKIFSEKTVHFIGIGGVGMSALASALVSLGADVSGSDITINSYTKAMLALGCKIFLSHNKENIENFDYVITSAAIKSSNLELIECENKKLNIISRSDLLKIFVDNLYSYAVAGAHGKTTSSSMLAHILQSIDENNSFLVGGTVKSLNTNSKFVKNGKTLTFEADESDGSLAKYNCTSAIITNIELDHIDFYKSFGDLLDVYKKFIKNVKKIIVCDKKEYDKFEFLKKAVTFSTEDNSANFFASNIMYHVYGLSFDLYVNQVFSKKIDLHVFGEHNLKNFLSVLALLVNENFSIDQIEKGMKSFLGVKRRFELLSKVKNDTQKSNFYLFDDYAHHPTEISSIYKLIASHFNEFKKIAFFEPHRISRLKYFKNEFIEVLNNFDDVYVFKCFEISGEVIDIQKVLPSTRFHFVDFHQIESIVNKYTSEKAIIISLNAGNLSGHLNSIYG